MSKIFTCPICASNDYQKDAELYRCSKCSVVFGNPESFGGSYVQTNELAKRRVSVVVSASGSPKKPRVAILVKLESQVEIVIDKKELNLYGRSAGADWQLLVRRPSKQSPWEYIWDRSPTGVDGSYGYDMVYNRKHDKRLTVDMTLSILGFDNERKQDD